MMSANVAAARESAALPGQVQYDLFFRAARNEMKRLAWIVPVVLAGASAAAMVDGDRTLKLEPPPKELRLYEGAFRLSQKTKIYVQLGHQSEDRIAAETLAEEIAEQSGLKLEIIAMKPTGKAEEGAIVLARLEDKSVRRFLARNGLQADESVGENGYLLFSDKSHLIVAANSGQGLFYGVQTLRQLLRPSGKGLICPAVGIRDWPSPVTFSVQDDKHAPRELVKAPMLRRTSPTRVVAYDPPEKFTFLPCFPIVRTGSLRKIVLPTHWNLPVRRN